MKINKKIIIILLTILLIGSNLIWFKLYTKEHNKLKHALIPSLSSDYFTTQKNLTEYHKQLIEEISAGEINKQFDTVKRDVPLVLQNPLYPNGCEAASTVMLFNYLNIDITLDYFVNKYLEMGEVYEQDGMRFGPNPAEFYAGDPKSETRGWGTFEPVIAKSVIKVIDDYRLNKKKFVITNEYNKLPLDVIATFKNPSIIWITQDYEPSNEVYEWFSYDKEYTYTYPKNSHTVLLTGVDKTYYYINDPLKDEQNIPVLKEKLESSFDSMGRQFVTIE